MSREDEELNERRRQSGGWWHWWVMMRVRAAEEDCRAPLDGAMVHFLCSFLRSFFVLPFGP